MSKPETFYWRVESTASGGGDFTTSKAKFGDNYSQIVAWGLNNDVESWDVTFSGSRAEVLECLTFIRARRGEESFYWTPPLSVQKTFRCPSYRVIDHVGFVFSLQLKFEESQYNEEPQAN